MLIYVVGRIPPPIGGVTIHTDRLIRWLSKIEGVQVKHIAINPMSLLSLVKNCIFPSSKKTIVHCQTSSWGLLIVVFSLLVSFSKVKLVYSIHSEYWVEDNLSVGKWKACVLKYCLRRVSLLIADNERIARDMHPYVGKIEVIVPFLPPLGQLGDEDLATYLQLPAFDAPTLVFNAYKLVYRTDGADVYGLDVLLKAYCKLDFPLVLILLIPQLSSGEKENIYTMLDDIRYDSNYQRVHIISDTDLDGWKVIAKASLFVRPTITDGDALSVREALYFGVPAIVSDCTVRPKGSHLFRTGDVESLCGTIVANIDGGEKVISNTSIENPTAAFFSSYNNLFKDST